MRFERIFPGEGEKFDQLVSKEPAFVKFYHPECIHCKNMSHDWDALEYEKENMEPYNVNIIEVHADALPEISSECKKDVNGFPTIMEVKPGGFTGNHHYGSRDLMGLREFLENNFELIDLRDLKKKKRKPKKKTKKSTKKSKKKQKNKKKKQKTKSRNRKSANTL